MTSCADQWSDSAPIGGDVQARARKYSIAGQITADCHKQSQFPAHNAIVILQTTTAQNDKQQQRDTDRHGIAESRYRYITMLWTSFCNASKHKLSLSLPQAWIISTGVLCDSSGLAQVQGYCSTGVLLCSYAGCVIQQYGDMTMEAYNGSVMM